jgi:hypothetical protein
MQDVAAANTGETLEVLVRLAFEFGPFLFAILFMMVITRMAQRFYERVRTREAPEASKQERAAYRAFFVSSFVFGMLLVALSVGWWFYAHLSDEHNYEIVIVDLPHGGHLSTMQYDRVYRQEIRNENNRRDGTVEYRLLIVSEEPYTPGEPIALRISYPREPPRTAQAPLAGGIGPAPAEDSRPAQATAEFAQVHDVSIPHNGKPGCRYTLNRLLRENGLMDLALMDGALMDGALMDLASSAATAPAKRADAGPAGFETGPDPRPTTHAPSRPASQAASWADSWAAFRAGSRAESPAPGPPAPSGGLPPSTPLPAAASALGDPAASLLDRLMRGGGRPESPLPAQQSLSNFCVTPSGSCVLPEYGPVGTPCWCNTPSGPVAGRLH